MKLADINPFLIRGYLDKEHFCDREAETRKLLRLLRNGNDVVSQKRVVDITSTTFFSSVG